METKDYQIKAFVRVRNLRLYNAIREEYGTVKSFFDDHLYKMLWHEKGSRSTAYTLLQNIITMRVIPSEEEREDISAFLKQKRLFNERIFDVTRQLVDKPRTCDVTEQFARLPSQESARLLSSMEVLPYAEKFEQDEAFEKFIEFIEQRLPRRLATILRLRFGIGYDDELSLKEIDQKLHLCRGGASALLNKALKKIRLDFLFEDDDLAKGLDHEAGIQKTRAQVMARIEEEIRKQEQSEQLQRELEAKNKEAAERRIKRLCELKELKATTRISEVPLSDNELLEEYEDHWRFGISHIAGGLGIPFEEGEWPDL